MKSKAELLRTSSQNQSMHNVRIDKNGFTQWIQVVPNESDQMFLQTLNLVTSANTICFSKALHSNINVKEPGRH